MAVYIEDWESRYPPDAVQTVIYNGGYLDGDTIEVEIVDNVTGERRKESIRVQNIDAFETQHGENSPGEPGGVETTARVAEMLRTVSPDNPLRIAMRGRDMYGRAIADVFIGDMALAPTLVQEGYVTYLETDVLRSGGVLHEEFRRAMVEGLQNPNNLLRDKTMLALSVNNHYLDLDHIRQVYGMEIREDAEGNIVFVPVDSRPNRYWGGSNPENLPLDLQADERNYRSGGFKIGATWLSLPPETVSVQVDNEIVTHRLLRSSGALAERTGHARMLVVINAKVTEQQLHGSLTPIMAQFVTCPFLPIRNLDVENMLYDEGLKFVRMSDSTAAREQIAAVTERIDNLKRDIEQSIDPGGNGRVGYLGRVLRILNGPDVSNLIMGLARAINNMAIDQRRPIDDVLTEVKRYWDDKTGNTFIQQVLTPVQGDIHDIIQDQIYLLGGDDPGPSDNPDGQDIFLRTIPAVAEARRREAVDNAVKQWTIDMARYMSALQEAGRGLRGANDPGRMTQVWVSQSSFSIAPDPGSDDCYAFNWVLEVFNYLPYTSSILWKNARGHGAASPEMSPAFMETWQRAIVPHWGRLDLGNGMPQFYVNAPFKEAGPTTLTLVDRSRPDEEDVTGITLVAAEVTLPVPPEGISFEYTGDYARIPLEGYRLPTLQYLGPGTATAVLSFSTQDEYLINTIKAMDNDAGIVASRFQSDGKLVYFTIRDPLLNAMGFYACEMPTLSITSRDVDSWNVQITLHKIIPTLREMHETTRIGGTARDKVDAIDWALRHVDETPVGKKMLDSITVYRPAYAGQSYADGYTLLTKELLEASKTAGYILREAAVVEKVEEVEKAPDAVKQIIEAYTSAVAEFSRLARQKTKADDLDDPITLGNDLEQLRGQMEQLEKIMEPITQIINRAPALYGSSLPQYLKEKLFTPDNQMDHAAWNSLNLYPDFPLVPISQTQTRSYYNYDQFQKTEEGAGFLSDPWHFLVFDEWDSKDGKPSVRSTSESASADKASREAQSGLRKFASITERWGEHDPTAVDGPASYSNQLNLDAMDLTMADVFDGPTLDRYTDYQNLGTVDPSLASFSQKLGEKARRSFSEQWQGLGGAFPTFFLAFLEKDADKYSLFSDFYDYRAIESISIHRVKNSPMDVCYLSISNLYGNLGGDGSRVYAGDENPATAVQETEFENPGLNYGKFPLQPGTEVILRLGFGNHVTKLWRAFSGHVAEVNEGSTMEIVLQGYGAELLDPIDPNLVDAIPVSGSAREFAELMLTMPKVTHFGRNSVGYFGGLLGLDVLTQHLNPDQALGQRKTGPELERASRTSTIFSTLDEKLKLYYLWSKTPEADRTVMDVNIWLPGSPFADGSIKFRYMNPFLVHGYSPWQVYQDLLLDHPGCVAGVRPYDSRATLFFGLPDQTIIPSTVAMEAVNRKNLGMGSDDLAERLPSFRQYHLCQSGRNLIRNELSNTMNFYNHVVLGWDIPNISVFVTGAKNVMAIGDLLLLGIPGAGKEAIKRSDGQISKSVEDPVRHDTVVKSYSSQDFSANAFNGSMSDRDKAVSGSSPYQAVGEKLSIMLDRQLPKDQLRMLYVEKRNVNSPERALRFAMSILGGATSHAYTGSIWMRSDRDIWPHDIIMLYDDVNMMYGPIEVEEVIMHFDREMGMVYEIRPNAVVSMQDYGGPENINYFKKYIATPSVLWDRGKESKDATIHYLFNTIPGNPTAQDQRMEHPISVFPLSYQGKPFWPVRHRGNTLDQYGIAGQESLGGSLVDTGFSVGESFRMIQGLYNNGGIKNVLAENL